MKKPTSKQATTTIATSADHNQNINKP